MLFGKGARANRSDLAFYPTGPTRAARGCGCSRTPVPSPLPACPDPVATGLHSVFAGSDHAKLERKLHSDLLSMSWRIAGNIAFGDVSKAAQWQSATTQRHLEMEHRPPSALWPISRIDSDVLACFPDRCSPSCETTPSAATSGVCVPSPCCTKRRYLSRRYSRPSHSSEYRFPLCTY